MGSDIHINSENDAAEGKLDLEIEEGGRLDKVLATLLPDYSRTRVKTLIEQGCVTDTTATAPRTIMEPARKVKPGTRLQIELPALEDPTPKAQDIALDVIYEDTDLIVVNKPAGMVVHPAPGAPDGTLVNALLHHCAGTLSGIGGVARPGIVHRIDKDTSGLLVVAKHDKAHQGLADQFADHSVQRIYTAFARKAPDRKKGTIDERLERARHDRKKIAIVPARAPEERGRRAVTHYRVKQTYGEVSAPVASRISCELETGRTHQIRVHLTHIGHPLIGDAAYGRGFKQLGGAYDPAAVAQIQSFPRQALHAGTLGFIHPVTGTFHSFECPLPDDLLELEKTLLSL
ncbi:MAG: RluA family pseudouridine synthase [Alphaproteobacteria bacterium]